MTEMFTSSWNFVRAASSLIRLLIQGFSKKMKLVIYSLKSSRQLTTVTGTKSATET